MTDTAVDQPLPGMPDPPELWALHVQGSDDILAMGSQEAADKSKAAHDAFDERLRAEDDPNVAFLNAQVVPWPYTAEAHARQLAERPSGR